MLELQLSVPKSAFEKTLGLLGIYNGDESDDLQSADGVSLSPESTLREIHYNFGETCEYTSLREGAFLGLALKGSHHLLDCFPNRAHHKGI